MIVPSLPALLTNPAWQVIRDFGPQVRAIDVDEMKKKSVLDVCPRTLDKLRVQDFLPSVQALHVRPSL